MAVQNTSLLFAAENQSPYYPGRSADFRIDTGDYFLKTFDYQYDLRFNELNTQLDATIYVEGRFGLIAYAYVTGTGSWDATYDIDVRVKYDGAIVTDPFDGEQDYAKFDFSDFTIVKSTFNSFGFGKTRDGSVDAGASFGIGIELIAELKAGIRGIEFFGPVPGGVDNFELGSISVFDQSYSIPFLQLERELGDTVWTQESSDLDSSITARMPTGANVTAESTGSSIVSGRNEADFPFLTMTSDLDKVATWLMQNKFKNPKIIKAGKVLEKTLFAEYDKSAGWGAVKLGFTMVDITAHLETRLVETFTLDITDPATGLPSVYVRLSSAGYDDTWARLGQSDILVPIAEGGYNTQSITAEYGIVSGQMEHTFGLSVTSSIVIDILKVSFGGWAVPDALSFSYGPVKDFKLPPDGWQPPLDNLVVLDFEVAGNAFNRVQDVYDIFQVEQNIAPDGWDSSLPSFEESIYGYFAAAKANNAAVQAEYSESGFDVLDAFDENDAYVVYGVFSDGSSGVSLKNWDGLFNNVFYAEGSADSRVLIKPRPVDQFGNLEVGNLGVGLYQRVAGNGFDGLGNAVVVADTYYDSDMAMKLDLLDVSQYSDSGRYGAVQLRHTFLGKHIQTPDLHIVDGSSGGDVLLYRHNSANGQYTDFLDGKANTTGTHDVFIGDFTHWTSDMVVDLPAASALDRDGNDATGGLTLSNSVSGEQVTIRGAEALVLRTGSGDDRVTTGIHEDWIETGAGADIVEVTTYDNLGDYSDDTIWLGSGNDVILTSDGINLPFELSPFTDRMFGGTGVDSLFYNTNLQELRWDTTYVVNGVNSYLFGGNGIGADATHGTLGVLLDYIMIDWADNYGVLEETETDGQAHILLLNGGPNQGRTEVARDIEKISIHNDNSGGNSDDLLVFMDGSRYVGGGGIDTFAADFAEFEIYTGTRGGLDIKVDQEFSYFGETIITQIERLYLRGTTDNDVIAGGALDDYIDGGDGDDHIYGGADDTADTLRGGEGDDIFLWQDNGNDNIDGGAGFDTVNIGAFQTPLDVDGDSFVSSGGHSYTFFEDGVQIGAAAQPGTLTVQFVENLFDWSTRATSQTSSFDFVNKVTYADIEAVNIRGSDQANDIMIYQGGTYYDAGESISGADRDFFIADFSGQEVGISFSINERANYDVDQGLLMDNGVFIRGFEGAGIRGGSGQDLLDGGRESDVFFGGAGDDILNGLEGNDYLAGEEGSDTFFYNDDDRDVMVGGTNAANFYVDGRLVQNEREQDQLIIWGGSGDTRIMLQDETGANLLNAFRGQAWAHNGTEDIVELAELSLTAHTWKYYMGDPGSNPTAVSLRHVTYSEMEVVNVAGQDDFDDIVVYQGGTAYVGGEREGDADVFVADLRDFNEDIFFNVDQSPGEGYDIGQGTIVADFERVVLLLGDGNDRVVGGALDDFVRAGAGEDTFVGGLGDDRFEGGDDDDLFEHSGGVDIFLGDGGDDRLTFSSDQAIEVFRYDGAGSPVDVSLSMAGLPPEYDDLFALFDGGGSRLVFTHGADSVEIESVEIIQISGSSQNDVLISGTTAGVLYGGDGDDFLVSRGGNDFLAAGAGNDIYAFEYEFGHDVIVGEQGESETLMFTGSLRDDMDFTVDGIDLVISDSFSSVRIIDYFLEDATVGLNYTFTDLLGTFTRSFETVEITSPGARAAGIAAYGDDTNEVETAGTETRDTYRGFGGDDHYSASGGSDIFDGGNGRDTVTYLPLMRGVAVDLEAQSGNVDGQLDHLVSIEIVDGTGFADVLIGDRFANEIDGNEGGDLIEGRGGNDLLKGGFGDDEIDGGTGGDVIYGMQGDDILRGGDGADILSGGLGDDDLEGGNGQDMLDGGEGDDTVSGGAGDDIFLYLEGFDQFDGGADMDTALFDVVETGLDIDLRPAIQTVTTREETPVLLASMVDIENVLGGQEDDRIFGNDGDNRLSGDTGEDLLEGHGGADRLDGGSGRDTVSYANEAGGAGIFADMTVEGSETVTDTFGNTDILIDVENLIGSAQGDLMFMGQYDNTVDGGAGSDTIYGGDGRDTLMGGDDADTLFGEEGGDALYGGAGADDLFGDDGDDTFFATDAVDGDTIDGGEGIDTLTYALLTTGVAVTMTGAGSGTVSGGGAASDSFSDIELVFGSTGDDSFTGSAAAETYGYVGGRDVVTGGGGLDTVTYALSEHSVHVDLVAGFAYTDETTALPSLDLITITELYDVQNIAGSAFADVLEGDGVANILMGGDGNDVLSGGLGFVSDSLFGGAGNDTLHHAYDLGSDLFDGGEGQDFLDFSLSGNGVIANLTTGVGTDTVLNVEGIRGSIYADLLTGDQFDNFLYGGDGSNLLMALEGNDIAIFDGVGFQRVDGGAGSDTLDFSQMDVAVGVFLSSGNIWTHDADVIDAAAGPQRNLGTAIAGTFENIIGTAKNDFVVGDDGANMIAVGAGSNTVYASGGDDLIVFGGGVGDYWDGGADNDTASFSTTLSAIDASLTRNRATYRDDTVSLADLVDIENLTGGQGDDLLEGNAAANVLEGMFGDDELSGLGGADTLRGHDGDDVLLGGADADVLDGGEGMDTASYAGAGSGVTVDLSGSLAATGDALGDTFISIENLRGTDHADILTGDTGENLLSGGGGIDQLFGGDGDDLVEGGAGADALDGGDGTDIAFYGYATTGLVVDLADAGLNTGEAAGDSFVDIEGILGGDLSDRLYGNGESNILVGMMGADMLYGREGDDVLNGGDGADTLDGGLGGDAMIGGAGDDIYYVDNESDTILELEGEGYDIVYTTVDITFGAHVEEVIFIGEAGVSAWGGDGNDIVTGNSGDNRFTGGLGNDVIDGGDGDDMVDYKQSISRVDVNLRIGKVTGGEGRDTLTSVERVVGSDFNDRLIGDNADNWLFGREGIDIIRTIGGTNTVDAGAGDDKVYGGLGIENVRGGDGADLIKTAAGNDVIRGDGGADVVRSGQGEDVLFGGDGDDRLFGNRGNDEIDGGDGADRLYGGSGADILFGGLGDDALRGESGVDWLRGGQGDDNLFGGENRDTFVFRDYGNSGFDRIKDWQEGIDRIDLSDFGFADFSEVEAIASNTGTLNMKLDFGGGNQVVIENFRLDQFDDSDVIWVTL